MKKLAKTVDSLLLFFHWVKTLRGRVVVVSVQWMNQLNNKVVVLSPQ